MFVLLFNEKTGNMKQISLLILGAMLFTVTAIASKTEDERTVYKVETDKSKIHWVGKKVSGQHNGTLSLDNSEVLVVGNDVVQASINMDMNSIVCEDLTDPQWNKKLVDHLKSDDFFSTNKFPKAKFVTTGFAVNPEAETNGENYMVTGDLTIKGITHEVSFPVNVEISGEQLTANGTAILDRTKWDVKYGSGSFFKGLGDKMIYDDFEIEFDLVANAETVN